MEQALIECGFDGREGAVRRSFRGFEGKLGDKDRASRYYRSLGGDSSDRTHNPCEIGGTCWISHHHHCEVTDQDPLATSGNRKGATRPVPLTEYTKTVVSIQQSSSEKCRPASKTSLPSSGERVMERCRAIPQQAPGLLTRMKLVNRLNGCSLIQDAGLR